MRVMTPRYEILAYPKDALQQIERAARTCYQSEKKIVEGSAEKLVRRLIDNGHHAMIEFGGLLVVQFFSNRGFADELVRHRIASFAAESSRYCNYSKDKFGGEITVIDPCFASLISKVKRPSLGRQIQEKLFNSWVTAESNYMDLIEMGCPAEMAREVLPLGVRTEIIISANLREWIHILKLRTSQRAHPRMRELMIPLHEELKILIPVIFDDI